MTRIPISKKIRFEVFKRDSFKCQYCGQSAPEVILHVDHIKPVVKDGDNDITNLVTSCKECNLGKGARELKDDSVIKKQKAQLDELNEKRIQLEMMVEWREALADMNNRYVFVIAKAFEKRASCELLYTGDVDSWLRKYDVTEILEVVEISCDQYLPDAQKAWTYIPKILRNRARDKESPGRAKLFYIRGIIKNRMYCNDWLCLAILVHAYKNGVSLDDLEMSARTTRNWSLWRNEMDGAVLASGGIPYGEE